MPSKARMAAIKLTVVALATCVSLVFAELVLRIFPSLIGVSILAHMEPGIRGEIAARLGLPTLESAIQISTDARSDKGPPFRLPGGNSLTVTYADKVDLALGAIELVQVDRNGLCNEQQKAITAKADILMSGDSFTFCTAVKMEDTAASRLQDIARASVYNLGVRGVGPNEYLEMLKLYAPTFKPKIAIMNIFEGNDLRGMVDNIKFHTGKGGLPKRHTPLREPNKQPARSYALQVIKAGFSIARSQLHKVGLRSKTDPEKVGHNFKYKAMLNGKPFEMNVNDEDQDEVRYAIMLAEKKVDLDVFAPAMKDFVDWAKEKEIIPVVAYIPSMYTVYQQTVEFQDANVGKLVQAFSAAQRAWFSKNAKALNYKYVDLTPQFQAAGSDGHLTHFPSNVHLTPFGHEVVAKGIFDLIKDDVANLKKPN